MKAFRFITSILTAIVFSFALGNVFAAALDTPQAIMPITVALLGAGFAFGPNVAFVNLITHALTYEREDVERFFLQPLFLAPSVLNIFDVMFDIKSSQKLDKFSSVEKISKAEAAGFNGSGGSVLTQRLIAVNRVEAEVAQSGREFFNSVKGELLKLGSQKDNIDGTLLMEIVAEIFFKGVQRDFNRQIWFNDTALASADYDIYDGIFKILDALPGAQKLVVAAGPLGADVAEATFQAQKDAAPDELLEDIENVVLLVSRSMEENYKQTLKDDGTELAHMNIVNGIQQLMWDGIPIIPQRHWDTHIAIDGFTGTDEITGVTDPHRSVLTTRGNIVIGTDFDEAGNAEVWYNPDEKEQRMRFQYLAGAQFRNDEHTVTAFAA